MNIEWWTAVPKMKTTPTELSERFHEAGVPIKTPLELECYRPRDKLSWAIFRFHSLPTSPSGLTFSQKMSTFALFWLSRQLIPAFPHALVSCLTDVAPMCPDLRLCVLFIQLELVIQGKVNPCSGATVATHICLRTNHICFEARARFPTGASRLPSNALLA